MNGERRRAGSDARAAAVLGRALAVVVAALGGTRASTAAAQTATRPDVPLVPGRDDFDAAIRAASAAAQRCRGDARVEVVEIRATFAPSGRVARARIVRAGATRPAPYAVGMTFFDWRVRLSPRARACALRAIAAARVPPFAWPRGFTITLPISFRDGS